MKRSAAIERLLSWPLAGRFVIATAIWVISFPASALVVEVIDHLPFVSHTYASWLIPLGVLVAGAISLGWLVGNEWAFAGPVVATGITLYLVRHDPNGAGAVIAVLFAAALAGAGVLWGIKLRRREKR